MAAKLMILGDICPDWGFPEHFATGDANRVFNDILPVLRDADYEVANLEAPATESIRRLDKNSVNLRARTRDVKALAEASIDAVAIANNHILDYDIEGLRDTIANLDDAGIAHYGARNMSTAYVPHFVKVGDIHAGFLAFAEREFNCEIDYGKGAALWDDLDGIRTIRAAKAGCDYLEVQYHGGIEHYRYPSPNLQKRCHAMAEAGADLVLCQHSHIIGTHEKWAGAEILYGQGNSVFGNLLMAMRRGTKGSYVKSHSNVISRRLTHTFTTFQLWRHRQERDLRMMLLARQYLCRSKKSLLALATPSISTVAGPDTARVRLRHIFLCSLVGA